MQCKTWDNAGRCLTCYNGYFLNNNSCVIQAGSQSNPTVNSGDLPASQDPYCNTYKNKTCVKCATRTYYNNATKLCAQVDSNCKSWNNFNGVCTECYIGYYLVNQMQCKLMNPAVATPQLKSSLNTDPNCLASNYQGICTQCIFRCILNPFKVCIQVNDQCNTWNPSTGACTSCYGGYNLNTSGACV
jgi:hypothetical protein